MLWNLCGFPDLSTSMFSLFFSFHLVLFFPSMLGARVSSSSPPPHTTTEERHIFLRDFTQGIMGSSEYYWGLALSDLPMSIVAPFIFGVLFYFMTGLRQNPMTSFGVFSGLIIMCGLGGSSIALFGRVGGGIYTKVRAVRS